MNIAMQIINEAKDSEQLNKICESHSELVEIEDDFLEEERSYIFNDNSKITIKPHLVYLNGKLIDKFD